MGLEFLGQPGDRVVQMAYVVPDIRKAMGHWAEVLKVGPWFLLEHFKGLDATYLGEPTDVEVSLALSFSGDMNVELIQQTNDAPSVYHDLIDKRGFGFHHLGIATWRYREELERYRQLGYQVAYELRVPCAGRVAYVDTSADLPGMTEVIELGPNFETKLKRFHSSSIGWGGRDPVRPFHRRFLSNDD